MNTVALILLIVALGLFLWEAALSRSKVSLGLTFFAAALMVQFLALTHTQHF